MDIVSACLCGINCKYNGGNNFHPKVYRLLIEGKAIPLCPEVLGGLPTPRTPCEIKGGKVFTRSGEDVTSYFHEGAVKTLKIAQAVGAKRAILKQRSPSCGCGKVYDGSFQGKLISGDGITCRLLKEHGIDVVTEEDI